MKGFKTLKEEMRTNKVNKGGLEIKTSEFSDSLKNASLPIHWVDNQGIIIWANQAELELLGYAEQEYIGFPIANFHADTDVINDILRRLEHDETVHNYPARLKCKDGRLKHVVINSNVLRKDGAFIHTRCFTTDVSEIINQEQQNTARLLQDNGNRLAAIVESTEDAIISKTLGGIITTWNPAAERIFGYRADETIGKHILILIPEDRINEEKLILERLKNGERVEHFETRRRTKFGKLIDVSLTISPLRDFNGNIIGLSKIARDITERKQQEQRKNDFVAVVSHELKTPLTAINSYIQLLVMRLRKTGDEFNLGILGRTENQAHKMLRMIGDFLSLARLEEGKIQINKEIFDLQLLMEEMVMDAKFLSAIHQVQLKGCESVYLNADRDKIGQVLMNLLSNAIKYSPDGGKIIMGCEHQNEQVLIYVRDQGIGIDPLHQNRLFERFYRVDDDNLKSVNGFGIGLYLVAEILKHHDSRIQVESQLGTGSNFFFSLDKCNNSRLLS